MTVIGPFGLKKIANLLLSENVVIGQSSSNCPGLSVCTVYYGHLSGHWVLYLWHLFKEV